MTMSMMLIMSMEMSAEDGDDVDYVDGDVPKMGPRRPKIGPKTPSWEPPGLFLGAKMVPKCAKTAQESPKTPSRPSCRRAGDPENPPIICFSKVFANAAFRA